MTKLKETAETVVVIEAELIDTKGDRLGHV